MQNLGLMPLSEYFTRQDGRTTNCSLVLPFSVKFAWSVNWLMAISVGVGCRWWRSSRTTWTITWRTLSCEQVRGPPIKRLAKRSKTTPPPSTASSTRWTSGNSRSILFLATYIVYRHYYTVIQDRLLRARGPWHWSIHGLQIPHDHIMYDKPESELMQACIFCVLGLQFRLQSEQKIGF